MLTTPSVSPENVSSSSEGENKRPETEIRKIAKQCWSFCDYMFRRGKELHETPVDTWRKIITVLAMFDIQLMFKNHTMNCSDGTKRMTFFVSHGKPRPMSSFTLSAHDAIHFTVVGDEWRAMCAKTFEENRHRFALVEPYPDFADIEKRKEAMRAAFTMLEEQGAVMKKERPIVAEAFN